jgi:hypothetical protein
VDFRGRKLPGCLRRVKGGGAFDFTGALFCFRKGRPRWCKRSISSSEIRILDEGDAQILRLLSGDSGFMPAWPGVVAERRRCTPAGVAVVGILALEGNGAVADPRSPAPPAAAAPTTWAGGADQNSNAVELRGHCRLYQRLGGGRATASLRGARRSRAHLSFVLGILWRPRGAVRSRWSRRGMPGAS